MKERRKVTDNFNRVEVLIASTVHDLNNLFTIFTGYPALMRDSLSKDQSIEKELDAFEVAAQRGNVLLKDLMDVTRSLEPKKETFSIEEVIVDLCSKGECEKMREDYPNIEISVFGVTDNEHYISTSLNLLEGIIVNLTRNACEAIGKQNEGTLDLFYTGACEDFVILEIQDSGGGIPEEDLIRIFKPFYSTKKMGRSGSGIGLSAAKVTIENLGGFIRICNVCDGTNIQLCLPRADFINEE